MLIVSVEMPPIARVGVSADFAHALSRGLIALGHDARVAMPSYRFVEDDARLNVRPVLDDLVLAWDDGSTRGAYVRTCLLDGVPFYLVGGEGRFRQTARLDGEDCALFARGVLAALRAIRPHWLPEVVHINDSCPGLAAVYLNALYLREWDIDTAAFVTTVHGEGNSRRVNTLVTGSRLEPDVRVVRRYRSGRRLASEYERIYNEALSQPEVRALAA
jgi:starch synthase